MKCKRCHFGRFQAAKLSYMMKLDDRFLIVPNIAAYRCDMCGNVIFSKSFLDRMQYILENLTQDDLASETRDRLTISEQLANWQAPGRNS